MIYKLSNNYFTVSIADKGAELLSVLSSDGCEYLWQGDAKYWEDRAPVLFPICSSLFGGKYTYGSKEYEMGMHGFAQYSVFNVKKANDSELVLSISSNEETSAQKDCTITSEYFSAISFSRFFAFSLELR